MPTPSDVFKAFDDKKYDEVIELLKKDSTLVNAYSEKCQSYLFQLGLFRGRTGDNPQALLEYLVTQQQFDFSLKSTEGSTTIHSNTVSLIKSRRIDLLQVALKDPMSINSTLIEGDGVLTYQLAVDELKVMNDTLERTERRRPNSDACVNLRTGIVTITEMISMLRDATILHALAHDDVSLLKTLDSVGGNPTGRMGVLGGEKPLNVLLTKDKTNIRLWLKEQSEVIDQSMKNNPNSFYNRGLKAAELENKKALLEQEYLTKKVSLIQCGVEKDSQHLDTVTSLVSHGTSIKK